MSYVPQLLCLVAVICLLTPRKTAIVLSVLALLLVTFLGIDKLILLFLLGLAAYKGVCIYRKQSSMPDVKTVVATVALTAVLVAAPFISMRMTSALLLSVLLVLLTPQIISFFRAHPMGLELPPLMNKRMLCSLLMFGLTFHMMDDASQGLPQADDGSSVVMMWLLCIAGVVVYGLALHRIPALIVSAIFYLIAFVYVSELKALGPLLSGLRRFSDVLDLFPLWTLIVFAMNLISLAGILVYTWSYKTNPTPPAWFADKLSHLSIKAQHHAATGVESAKAFAETHQINDKLEHSSEQLKSRLAPQLNWIKSKHQQNPTQLMLGVFIIGSLLLWLLL